MRVGYYNLSLKDAIREESIEFFMLRVTKQEDGCWLFNSYGRNQYAKITINRERHLTAHRVSYMMFYGVIEDEVHVHHICQVKGCVNPTHLMAMSPVDHKREHIRLSRLSSQI